MANEKPIPGDESQAQVLKIRLHMRVAWLATGLTLSMYFCLMIVVALAPLTLTQTISVDSAVTWGVVIGIAIIILLIFVAGAFTIWNNKVDERS